MDQNNTEIPAPSAEPPVVTPRQAKQRPAKESWRNVASTIAILIIAPLVAILLTSFVFQSYEVSGPSMETTLENNDRLIVWKLPRTWSRLTGHAYLPKRGDIVIFNEDGLPDGDKQLIKRVIGLPGDRLVIQNGAVIVYNRAHPAGFRPDTALPYGQVIGDTEPETDQQQWTIGKDQLFVMGDHRDDSYDSRSFGPIATSQIIGKLVIRVAPFSKAQRF